MSSYNITVSGNISAAQVKTGTGAYDFTALTQSLATYPSLTVPSWTVTSDWTCEMFVYLTAVESTYGTVLYVGSATTNAFVIALSISGGMLQLFLNAGTINVGSISNNAWHHVALSYSASAGRIYGALDGVAVSQSISALTSIVGAPMSMLHRRDYNGQYCRGYVDCVRVSQSCIYTAANYSVPAPGAWTTATCLFVDQCQLNPIIPGCVYVNGADAGPTLSGTTFITERAGPTGLAKSAFVIAPSRYIDVGTNSAIDFTYTNTFSFGGWFYMTAYGSLMSNETSTPSISGFDLKMTAVSGSTQLETYSGGAATSSSTFTIPFYQWCHVWVMYDETTRTATIYVNGTVVTTLVIPASAFSTGASWKIFKNSRFGAATGGNVADVRFYTSAVSAATAMSNIKFQWSLDTTPFLSATSSYSGSSALYFPGPGATVNATTCPSLQITGLDVKADFTVEAFMYVGADAMNPVMSMGRSMTLNDYEYVLKSFNNFQSNNTTFNTKSTFIINTKINSGVWVHVAVTYQQSTTKYFIGIGGTVTSIVNVTSDIKASPLDFFWRRDLSTQIGKGWIDSLRVSQAALYVANYTVPVPTSWSVGGSTLFVDTFEIPSVSGSVSGDAITITPSGTAPFTYMWKDGATTQNRSNLASGAYSVVVTDANGRSVTSASFTAVGPFTPVNTDDMPLWYTFEPSTVSGTSVGNLGKQASASLTLVNGATVGSGGGKIGSQGLTVVSSGSQYARLPSFTPTTAGLSIAVWFKSTSTNAARIFDFGRADGQLIDCFGFVPGSTDFYNFDAGSWQNSAGGVTSSTNAYINGGWHHAVITLTYSASNTSTYKLYMNGSLVSTSTGNKYPTQVARDGNYLGRAAGGTPWILDGSIDDFRVYNKVIVAADVTALYAYTIPKITAAVVANQAITLTVTGTAPLTYAWSDGATTQNRSGLAAGDYTITITDGNGYTNSASYTITPPPVLLYRIGFSDSLSASDGTLVGAMGSPTLQGGGTATYMNGPSANVPRGIVVNGTGQYVQLPYSASLEVVVTTSFSMGGWIYADAAPSGNEYCFLSNYSSTFGQRGIEWIIWNWGNPTLRMTVHAWGSMGRDAPDSTTAFAPTIRVWTHWWATYDATTRLFTVYKDGTVWTTNTYQAGNNYTSGAGWMLGLSSRQALYSKTAYADMRWYAGVVTPADAMASLTSITASSTTNCSAYGVNDGTITLTTLTGTSPYTFAWVDNGSASAVTTRNRTGLGPGVYSVIFTANGSSSGSTSFTITQPNSPLVVTISGTNTTGGLSNGAASVSASGGTGSYTYSWKRGASATVISTASSLTSQQAGVYVCTITSGAATIEKTVAIQPVLTYSNLTSISVSLAWQAIPGATMYRVSTIDRAINTPVIPGTSYTLYGLTHSKSYTLMLFSSNGTNFVPNTDCTVTFTTAAANDTGSITTVMNNLKSTSGANAAFALQSLDPTSFNIIKENLSTVAASGDKLTFNKKNSTGSVEAAFSATFARPGATVALAAPTKGSLSAASNVLLDFKAGVSNQSAVQLSVNGANVDVSFDTAANKVVVGGVTRSVGDEFVVNGQLCTVEEI